MTYSKITKAQFDEMQTDAGVLLRSFNPSAPSIEDSDIICATTGGISLSIEPSIEDLSDDVYMMDSHTIEMMSITGYSVSADFTSLSSSAQMIGLALGAASTSNGIVPRYELRNEDFQDIWWVGDRFDGGLVAVRFINALSDDGLSITAQPKGVGNLAVHITAHTSFDLGGAVPVEIYSVENRPFFDVVQHQFLFAYNMDEDDFRVDEETGNLYITSSSGWIYTVNENTGKMEISK